MAPENRRVGCLLISVATDRVWKNPTTGVNLSIEQVVANLQVEADELEKALGYESKILVRWLNLRKRIV